MNIPVTNLDLKQAQQRVEANIELVRHLGRKTTLAYLGLWGMTFDAVKSCMIDGAGIIDKAERRGEQIEADVISRATEVERRISQGMKQWRGRTEQLTESFQGMQTMVAPASESPTAPAPIIAPLPKYDELTAKEVIAQMAGLTLEQLEALRVYELAHAGRVTVLRQVDEALKRLLAVA